MCDTNILTTTQTHSNMESICFLIKEPTVAHGRVTSVCLSFKRFQEKSNENAYMI